MLATNWEDAESEQDETYLDFKKIRVATLINHGKHMVILNEFLVAKNPIKTHHFSCQWLSDERYRHKLMNECAATRPQELRTKPIKKLTAVQSSQDMAIF